MRGERPKGRHEKRWEHNIAECTAFELGETLREAENRARIEKSGCLIILGAPSGHSDLGTSGMDK